ncbi:MAG: hypothetical protein CVV42_08140 [Candidatus Riflebacteria bacterium HGW-Riflebacteria-2]|jgi:hypothetical protein|nr:MAG: hypothetical protein CVV42_08140 [Candidatus Riflebacteria bacterium HGW-Riflebacteria-2]
MSPTDPQTLILAPFKAEARLLAAILPDCRQSDAASWFFKGGRLVTANAAGGDPLFALLDRELTQASYRRIILFGAAGALAPELQVGQLFCCNRFFYACRQLELPAPADLPPAAVVTVDQPAITRDDRAQLAAKYDASLVDMESFFFAEAMQGRELNGAVIRFVSDTAEQVFVLPFPPAVSRNISQARSLILKALL